MRQLVGQSQELAQRRTERQHFHYSPIGRLQVGPQHQTTHQLALRKIVPAARRTVISQVRAAQSHRQLGHLLDDRSLPFLVLPFHPIITLTSKKGFYKATWLSALQFRRTLVRRYRPWVRGKAPID